MSSQDDGFELGEWKVIARLKLRAIIACKEQLKSIERKLKT